ncbi:COG1470 family protein [Solirubrobacter soli]|uniref:COG1470 family protein n=1 Tax=Solirubrobacter soli TaxID=363832 RepID=UPI0012FACF63|nr:NEW3 domain-containing protein [Solirubrobacter soli]
MRPISPRSLLLLTLGLVGLLAPPAAAADWTAAPAANQFGEGRQAFSYTINPGGQMEDGLVVVNDGAAPVHVALRTAKGPMSAWVRPSRDDVTVPAGDSVEVPFTVSLPKDAAAGDYASGIAGIPIRLRVGGALKPSLAIEDVRIGDSTVTYTIRNTGNATLTAHAAVSVSGPFGRWTAKAGTLPDSPPLLPGATWKGTAPVRDVTPAVRLTATVTLTPLLTDEAGSTAPLAPIKATGHGWAIPWLPLLALVVLIAVVAGVVARLRRRPARIAA